MAIEVSSAGWTGTEDTPPDTAVCGQFDDQSALDSAMSKMEGSAFQRADFSVRKASEVEEKDPARDDDTRNLRTLGTSVASAGAAMAAAGVVIATGGLAAPAVAAAAAVGGATAAAGTAVGQAASPEKPEDAKTATMAEPLVLVVNATNAEKQSMAESMLRDAGATRIWRQQAA